MAQVATSASIQQAVLLATSASKKNPGGQLHDEMTSAAVASADIFRDYEVLDENTRVPRFYKEQHEKQTYAYVQDAKKEFYSFNHAKHTIMELFAASDSIVDESDPDLHLSQLHHAIQTAERARNTYPDPEMDWFWFTAFIHDLGKILTNYGVPQWSVVGDSFPVGCAFDPTNIFYKYFSANADNGKFDKLGKYQQNCGFDAVQFSFGHDDYLACILEHNGHNLPYEALYCIRYHSFYPWHKHGGYDHLASDRDRQLRPILQQFQACDLYSKDDDNVLDYTELEAFYTALADKFIGLTKVMEL